MNAPSTASPVDTLAVRPFVAPGARSDDLANGESPGNGSAVTPSGFAGDTSATAPVANPLSTSPPARTSDGPRQSEYRSETAAGPEPATTTSAVARVSSPGRIAPFPSAASDLGGASAPIRQAGSASTDSPSAIRRDATSDPSGRSTIAAGPSSIADNAAPPASRNRLTPPSMAPTSSSSPAVAGAMPPSVRPLLGPATPASPSGETTESQRLIGQTNRSGTAFVDGPASSTPNNEATAHDPARRSRPTAEHTAALRNRFGQRAAASATPGQATPAVGVPHLAGERAPQAATLPLRDAVAAEVAEQLHGVSAGASATATGHSSEAASDPAQAFEEALRRSPAASTPLPQSWRPLANAIVGDRAVRISSGAASRRALRAAGKVAATAGNVIHLATPLQGMNDAPVLAHELTHVASPSPAPRFYDDDRDSPEERRAELVADVIRRSPVLPRPHAAGAAPSLSSSAPVIRRSLADEPSGFQADDDGPSTPGAVTAADLVRRYTGGGSSNDSNVVRRTPSASSTTSSMPSIQRRVDPASFDRSSGSHQSDSQTIRRSADASANPTIRRAMDGGGSGHVPQWNVLADAVDSSGVQNFVDWIMEQVESRMARELERRGGHYRGDF